MPVRSIGKFIGHGCTSTLYSEYDDPQTALENHHAHVSIPKNNTVKLAVGHVRQEVTWMWLMRFLIIIIYHPSEVTFIYFSA